jgi:hypothetical protein
MQDARRKFIWEEMSYLERWWRDASETKRESFVNLVKNGQVEIVGGGWVMNDEVIFMGFYLCLNTVSSDLNSYILKIMEKFICPFYEFFLPKLLILEKILSILVLMNWKLDLPCHSLWMQANSHYFAIIEQVN